MSDVLITPASSKIEFKDASSNIDGVVKLDSDGNLELTSNNGISFGDTSSDVFIGNGTDNVDLKFEADGSITGTSGVTLTIGSTVSNVKIASDELQINATSGVITATTFSGNLNGTLTVVDESSDTSCYPLFVNSATGNLAPKTGSNLTFNSSSGRLTTTQLLAYDNVLVYGNIVGDGATRIQSIDYLASGASTNDIVLKLKPGGSASNVGLGKSALKDVTTATDCIAIGSGALVNHTVEGNNITGQIAIGSSAMETFTVVSVGGYSDGLISASGSGHNIAIGLEALQYNVRSNGNIAIGEKALRNFNQDRISSSNSNGLNNIGIGYEALRGDTTDIFFGKYNVAVGWNAGRLLKLGADYNTMVGTAAGSGGFQGDNNTCIGYNAGVSAYDVNNEITLGNSSIATLRCNVQTISSLSDARDKTDIVDIPTGLDFLNDLRPVKFKWQTRDGNGKDGSISAGFLAQDLQKTQKDSSAEFLNLVMDSNPDRLEAREGQLIPVLVKAIQELSAKNDALEARIKALES